MHKTKTSTTLGDVQIQPPEKLSKFHLHPTGDVYCACHILAWLVHWKLS